MDIAAIEVRDCYFLIQDRFAAVRLKTRKVYESSGLYDNQRQTALLIVHIPTINVYHLFCRKEIQW